MLKDKKELLDKAEKDLQVQLEAVKSKKEKMASGPLGPPRVIPADASPYCMSSATKAEKQEAAETDVAKNARSELRTYENLWTALKGDDSEVAAAHRADLENKIKELRKKINLEKDPSEQVALMERVVTQQSEKLQKAIKKEGDIKMSYEQAVQSLNTRKQKFRDAQEGLFAAQKKLTERTAELEAMKARQGEKREMTQDGPISRQQLLSLLAMASAMGPEAQQNTVQAIQLLEGILSKPMAVNGTITPPPAPTTPIRKTGRRSPTFVPVSPARQAAAEAAQQSAIAVKHAEEALARADVLQQAAKDEEMGETPVPSTNSEKPVEITGATDTTVAETPWPSFMQLPEPLDKTKEVAVQRVQFADDSSEDLATGFPPLVTDKGQLSLHSFLHPKKGTKSQNATRGRTVRAQLAVVNGSRKEERSRSPVPDSSEEKEEEEADGEEESDDWEQPGSGFGAAGAPKETA